MLESQSPVEFVHVILNLMIYSSPSSAQKEPYKWDIITDVGALTKCLEFSVGVEVLLDL